VLPGFEYQKQELMKNLQEAKDVSRFLSTIERHLKTLTYSHSFTEMAEAIPHIMEGLQLVWMLSRHYKDERMCTLLEMIAKLLYDRTTAVLHPKNLFKK
jgi:dynein heavy chain